MRLCTQSRVGNVAELLESVEEAQRRALERDNLQVDKNLPKIEVSERNARFVVLNARHTSWQGGKATQRDQENF